MNHTPDIRLGRMRSIAQRQVGTLCNLCLRAPADESVGTCRIIAQRGQFDELATRKEFAAGTSRRRAAPNPTCALRRRLSSHKMPKDREASPARLDVISGRCAARGNRISTIRKERNQSAFLPRSPLFAAFATMTAAGQRAEARHELQQREQLASLRADRMAFAVRSNSATPISSSRSRICRLSGGCDTRRRAAA